MLALDDGAATTAPAVTLVPGFDEWVLGYQDRTLVASPAAQRAVATVNGIFRPAVVVDGVVVGTWAVGAKPGKARQLTLVEPVTPAQQRAIEAALEAWAYG
jgi:hypothetical protein